MDVFNLCGALIEDYQSYVESFNHVAGGRIRGKVEGELDAELLWPESLVQVNASFKSGGFVGDLVAQGLLDPECAKISGVGKDGSEVAPALTPQSRPLRALLLSSQTPQSRTRGGRFAFTVTRPRPGGRHDAQGAGHCSVVDRVAGAPSAPGDIPGGKRDYGEMRRVHQRTGEAACATGDVRAIAYHRVGGGLSMNGRGWAREWR